MRKLTRILYVCLPIFACDENALSPGGRFPIKVVEEGRQPVFGAHIHGGFDWTDFDEVTDQNGMAWLPDHVFHGQVMIYKNNFFSKRVNDVHSGEYIIYKTPYELAKIGEIDGGERARAIKFSGNRVSTVTYQAGYRLYEIGETGLTELAAVDLQDQVKEFELFGDTIWYTTHENGVLAYTLEDPFAPRPLFRLGIGGYLLHFARMDTLIAVAYETLRLFSYSQDGSATLLDTINDPIVGDVAFMSGYLVTLDTYSTTPLKVYDIGNPNDIVLVYDESFGEYRGGFIHGDSAVLISNVADENLGVYNYLMMDLTDPVHPQTSYSFSADGIIEEISNDSIAVGRYIFDYSALTVFRRADDGDFRAISMIPQHLFFIEHGGGSAPYFIIDNGLYKLIERTAR